MILNRTARKLIKKNNITIDEIPSRIISDFKDEIKCSVNDPRQKEKIIYKVWDIIIVVFLAIICNCNDWDEIVVFAKAKYDYLRKYLKMTGGIPSAITYERVIASIDKQELQNVCLSFIFDIINLKKKKSREIINIDGKQDISSSYHRLKDDGSIETIKNLNVLNAYSNNYDICLSSIMIEDKTNEITAFPDMIKTLNIRNAIITVDALNTQKENCKIVIKKRGDYVFALKGNQGNFYEDVKLYFTDEVLKKLAKKDNCHKHEVENRGNETVIYDYYQTDDVTWYSEYKLWKCLKTIGIVVKKIIKIDGTEVIEKRYYISSLDVDINLFSKSIRMHWSVENKLHWQLDFSFKQDDNTTINKDALLGLQVIKKTVLAFLNPIKENKNMSMNKLRLNISYNVEKELDNIFNFYAKKPKFLARILSD